MPLTKEDSARHLSGHLNTERERDDLAGLVFLSSSYDVGLVVVVRTQSVAWITIPVWVSIAQVPCVD